MVNARTIAQLYAAICDVVPGRAQRQRLLEALKRVTGNKAVTEAMSALYDKEALSRGPAKAPVSQPQSTGTGIKARVVTYTQSSPEVHVCMTLEAAQRLKEELGASVPPAGDLGRTSRMLISALHEAAPNREK